MLEDNCPCTFAPVQNRRRANLVLSARIVCQKVNPELILKCDKRRIAGNPDGNIPCYGVVVSKLLLFVLVRLPDRLVASVADSRRDKYLRAFGTVMERRLLSEIVLIEVGDPVRNERPSRIIDFLRSIR